MDKLKTILLNLHLWQKIAETGILYVLFPLAIVAGFISIPLWLVLILMGAASMLYLLFDKSFDKNRLINWEKTKKGLLPTFAFFLLAALVMLAFVAIVKPSKLFSYPVYDSWMSVELFIIYPLFSVIPQELGYRVFFFHRYGELFSSKWAIILASALFFSFCHIHFLSPLVLLLTFIAGLIFAYRYYTYKSLLLSAIEHTLYGVWLYFSGLGAYFISQI